MIAKYKWLFASSAAVLMWAGSSSVSFSQAPVPGTGTVLNAVGDDFEDPAWAYALNLPKVFNNLETEAAKNLPLGATSNSRWREGMKRGQPDSVRRVKTPQGGMPASTTAMALRTFQTGPGYSTHQQQQDDFIGSIADIVGKLPPSQQPSVVTRVWLPPWQYWEQRSGCHFAFRIAMETEKSTIQSAGYQRGTVKTIGENWPGFFLDLQVKDAQAPIDDANRYRAHFWLKADQLGQRIEGPEITQTGWWTLGISLSADGQVHYFAKPGVDDLTAADHVASAFPHGDRATCLRNFFFCICNGDDGKNWSTEFVVDDTRVYVVK